MHKLTTLVIFIPQDSFFFFLGVTKNFITQTQQNSTPDAWKHGSNKNQTQNHKHFLITEETTNNTKSQHNQL
jgi:hypothetical protein